MLTLLFDLQQSTITQRCFKNLESKIKVFGNVNEMKYLWKQKENWCYEIRICEI